MKWMLAVIGLLGGCYHYTYVAPVATIGPRRTVTYKLHRAAWLNGAIGEKRVDHLPSCARPLRTEVKVTAGDAAIAASTLLIYTPRTLYVTCEAASKM
jgi:hypothetical protein